jgi:hypothetical protein
MNRKLISTLVVGLLAFNILFAQKEDSLQVVKELNALKIAEKDFRKNQDISVFQTMQSTNLMQTSKGKSGLSMSLAESKMALHKKMTKLGAPATQTDSIRREIYADFAEAIKVCEECSNYYRLLRLDFLATEKDKRFYQSELTALQALGYTKKRSGLSIGLAAQSGTYTPNSRFRYYVDPITGKTTSKILVGLKASALNFEVLWNLNQKATDINFSLFKFSAPFYLDITKFGALRYASDGKAYWYYRPEIGFGWNVISAGYAFNYTFAKEKRMQLERHLFFVKISYPLFKTK